MKNRITLLFLVLLIAAFLTPQAFCEPPKEMKKQEVNNPSFHKQLLEIAQKYESYGKVDDMARWAPGMCAAPPPPALRLSKAGSKSPHTRKLYYLFAADRSDYVLKKPSKVGQVVVKEAWYPQVKVNSDSTKSAVPTKKNALFIMMKLDPATLDTDKGWVYGTVTPDGKTVTSSGKVESCMGCHVQVKGDRLFYIEDMWKDLRPMSRNMIQVHDKK